MRQVARDLGVRYVLEGGVRKAGNRLRITAQLIEAETGTHLWAEKYDGSLEDVFDLQDQITDKVVGIVEPSVRQSEIERSRQKRPENLGAYDLYLRALPYITAQMPEDIKSAMPLLEEALRLQPNYAIAHALIAWCYELRFARAGLDANDKASALASCPDDPRQRHRRRHGARGCGVRGVSSWQRSRRCAPRLYSILSTASNMSCKSCGRDRR